MCGLFLDDDYWYSFIIKLRFNSQVCFLGFVSFCLSLSMILHSRCLPLSTHVFPQRLPPRRSGRLQSSKRTLSRWPHSVSYAELLIHSLSFASSPLSFVSHTWDESSFLATTPKACLFLPKLTQVLRVKLCSLHVLAWGFKGSVISVRARSSFNLLFH